MRVLLIWNEIPETMKMFIFENPTVRIMDILEASHNKHVNSVELTPELDYLSDMIYGSKDKYGVDLVERLEPAWEEGDDPLKGSFDRIYVSGFLL